MQKYSINGAAPQAIVAVSVNVDSTRAKSKRGGRESSNGDRGIRPAAPCFLRQEADEGDDQAHQGAPCWRNSSSGPKLIFHL